MFRWQLLDTAWVHNIITKQNDPEPIGLKGHYILIDDIPLSQDHEEDLEFDFLATRDPHETVGGTGDIGESVCLCRLYFFLLRLTINTWIYTRICRRSSWFHTSQIMSSFWRKPFKIKECDERVDSFFYRCIERVSF